MSYSLLQINSSAKSNDTSVTRHMVREITDWFKNQQAGIEVIDRDLVNSLAFINNDWVEANFTPAESRTDQQDQVLSQSNELVNELFQSDVIVIGVPIYNFSIPAALKAWIDQVSRAKVTFQYSEKGPEGLVNNKRAILVYASGGTPLGSEIDFATPYLKYILGFMGIDDVTIIDANQAGKDNWSLDQQLLSFKPIVKKYA
jgi:FMN-dependent NADH-azoreductase